MQSLLFVLVDPFRSDLRELVFTEESLEVMNVSPISPLRFLLGDMLL
jgi:hypothetical protein